MTEHKTCKHTHQNWTQDASSKAYDKPFYPGAVAERAGIKDLEGNNGRMSQDQCNVEQKDPQGHASEGNIHQTQCFLQTQADTFLKRKYTYH